MQLNERAAGAVLVLLLMGAVTSACGSGSTAATTTAAAGGSSTTSAASAGSAPSLSALTSSVQAQITGTGANDFSVTGLSKLTCDPPAIWKAGVTFKCFAFDFANDEMGEYDATVQPESGGSPQWNGLWSPK
jgi:hypothetical protein